MDQPSAGSRPALGRRLRSLRTGRGLTLEQLGRQVGLSASYLSQIERGALTPSLPKLSAIARTLSLDVRDFFEEEGAPACVVRSRQGGVLRDTGTVVVELLSADPPGKSILPYRVVCQPGTSCERPSTYPGEECAFVLEGQLTITVGGERFVLHPGDSIHYQRHQVHSWCNEGDDECVVIWAAAPPVTDAELIG